jgi:hypothetical protein
MYFIDFSQLNSIIVSNWRLFEILLRRQVWVQAIFETMERSRNVIMHSGELPRRRYREGWNQPSRLDEANRRLTLEPPVHVQKTCEVAV